MRTSYRRRPGRFLALAWAAACLALPAAARGQGLQQLIDAASPGDTVWVAPGNYTRTVTVDKAITLHAEGPGDSRLARLEGSEATVIGLVFDGSLPAVPSTSVVAGDGLTLLDCRFEEGVRGVEIQPGADVALHGCTMTGVLEGLSFVSGLGSLLLEDCALSVSVAGLIGPDTLECGAPGPRAPAARCDGLPCAPISLVDCSLTGGARQIEVFGDYRLVLTRSSLTGSSNFGIRGGGIRLEMTASVVSGTGAGVALSLDSASGFVRGSEILAFGQALRIGDGGCSAYSDLAVGGSLDGGNDIGGGQIVFQLDQPESIDVEFNFWGSTDCEAVLPQISGQAVSAITDAEHQSVFLCGGTAVEPTTWGVLKRRYRRP